MAIYFSKPGLVCATGNTLQQLWNAVTTKNQSGIKKVTACTGDEFFAGKVDDSLLKPSTGRYDMRIIRIEEAALYQLDTEIAAAKEKFGAERIAVCIGSCDNGTEFSIAGHKQYFAQEKFPENYNIEMQGADYVASFVAEKYEIKGPATAFSTACSSSAGAIIKAAEMIKAGIVDAAIVGGIDIASDTVLIGFNSLEAVSSEIVNPFSKNRHGITLGEAGVFFVISKEPVTADQNIQLLGWGESSDAYHATSPDPSGAGALKAMTRAMESAGLKPEDVDYVNLHGTGTKFNDSMEAKAVDGVFGDVKVAVSTTKAVTGHTLGAAAALEAAICYAAIENFAKSGAENGTAKLPVQIWDEEQDPELPALNIISPKSGNLPSKVKICLSNSFAFGGANATLVIGAVN